MNTTTTLKLDDALEPQESPSARLRAALGLGSLWFSAVAVATTLTGTGEASFLIAAVSFTIAMCLLAGRAVLDVQVKRSMGRSTRFAHFAVIYAVVMATLGAGLTVAAAISVFA